MNKFLLIFLSILLLSLASSLYAGESQVYSNDLGKTNLVWTIIENTSPITVLPLVTIDVSNITIQIPSDMPPQSFKLVFMEESTTTVVQTITVSSGGHSRIKIVNQTIIKEVPTYIQVENKTIEYKNQTITKWETIEKPNKWSWILSGGVFGVLLIFLYFAYRLSNKYNDERRYEE